MLPAQLRSVMGSPSVSRLPGPKYLDPDQYQALVIMVPRTEIPAVFSGDFGPAGPKSPGTKSL